MASRQTVELSKLYRECVAALQANPEMPLDELEICCSALIVDYSRAPENIHPGPVNDMAKSYKWLLDQGIRPGHIAVIGDSAGGGFAITTPLRAREQGLPLPGGNKVAGSQPAACGRHVRTGFRQSIPSSI